MAKKKTIDKKDGINKKKAITESEKRDVDTVMQGVNLIKQGIKVAALMNKVSGGDMATMISMMAIVVDDFTRALAYAAEESQQKVMEDFSMLSATTRTMTLSTNPTWT